MKKRKIKIKIILDKDDVKFWNNEVSLNSLQADLAHKFDIPKEKISITFK